MSRNEIIKTLSLYKDEFAEKYGILDIGVFGSIARGDSTEISDVDVVVHILKPDLFTLAGIKTDLEERLHSSVDIVTYRESMNQYLKKKIDSEAVYA